MRLTDISIKALKPPAKGQVTYADDAVPGFGVRVSQGGVKAFVIVHGRSRRRATIGRYPIISLQDARKAAKALLAERILGKHDTPPIDFEEALTLFLSTHFPETYPKPRTKEETKRLLERHFLAPLRHDKIADIQTQEISRIIDRLQNTPSEARHAFAAIRQFFNWAAGRGYVTRSPCERLHAPGKAVPRDRVLTSEEMKLVLASARADDSTFSRIVQLLLLTGQRRNEIASLRAEWIDFKNRTITLPRQVTKNKRQHTFPFGRMTEAVLKSALPKTDEKNNEKPKLLFAARGKETPFAGWSKAKPNFDSTCPVAHWTLHDLRRTCATNLAALGVPVHVTEKLLNHVSGTTSGIVAVYQRHTYLDEMRKAIDAWEKRLRSLNSRKARLDGHNSSS
jgi:integrase